ncbi:hypothetical protein HUG10_07685 [Halorarum halophilum]|uniref:DUF8163 domain-containing protein n=1 Tax=Halorarum halophilum TaxID=2743090 RepID=A0A7D5KF79_9EURY|nr:hypothetical protein [Halobaculum halophilum]QLG27436.1 hypothetical protein HUG10_07685 [Halobaculum halophilum]
MFSRLASRRYRLTPAPVIGTTVLSLVLGVLAGPLGALGGVVSGLLAVLFGPVAGILIAHLVAVLLLGRPTGVDLLLVELGVAPLLATPLVDRPTTRDAVLVGCSSIALAAVIILADTSTASLWLVASTLAGCVAMTGYALHRYELVVLDLVPADATDAPLMRGGT